jgi:hypothetical protein
MAQSGLKSILKGSPFRRTYDSLRDTFDVQTDQATCPCLLDYNAPEHAAKVAVARSSAPRPSTSQFSLAVPRKIECGRPVVLFREVSDGYTAIRVWGQCRAVDPNSTDSALQHATEVDIVRGETIQPAPVVELLAAAAPTETPSEGAATSEEFGAGILDGEEA